VYKIMQAATLDHEDRATRRVTIRCRDSDKNPLMATKAFDVKVIDVNDNAPKFTQVFFTGAVLENNPAGTNVMVMVHAGEAQNTDVLRVVAEDYDSGELGRVSYTIPVPTNFSVDPVTGMLSTLVSFDREERVNYTFPVVAADGGNPPLTATTTVTVSVLDQNDHPPRFLQPIYFLSVREEQPPEADCGRVEALDEDTGDNARMVYAIMRAGVEDDSRYFKVDEDTGDITTNQLLDRETRDSYAFTLEVRNPSTPSFKDSTQVFNVCVCVCMCVCFFLPVAIIICFQKDTELNQSIVSHSLSVLHYTLLTQTCKLLCRFACQS
jgi:hypothetical protein